MRSGGLCGNFLDRFDLVAANDDSSGLYQCPFAATLATYRIAVDGFRFDTGDIFLSREAEPRVGAKHEQAA
jgi:hypothetical protein